MSERMWLSEELEKTRTERDQALLDILSLVTELEKAREEALCPDCQTIHDQLRKRIAEVEAQRDAANRLLEECVVEFELAGARAALCARIDAHLKKHGLK